MLYSSGPAASAVFVDAAPAWPPGWPQFGQNRASSPNCEPQFVQNAMGSPRFQKLEFQTANFSSLMAAPAPLRLARRISEYLRERTTPCAPARKAAATAS